MTSDEFFRFMDDRRPDDKFDIIFIDGYINHIK